MDHCEGWIYFVQLGVGIGILLVIVVEWLRK